jgi:hypothetical protein
MAIVKALWVVVCVVALAQFMPQPSLAQRSQSTAAAEQKDAILLTIFLRHDESKVLDEINDHLRKTGRYDKFPPEGVEVVSWYVMMGIGQVVTLRVPPDKLGKSTALSSRMPGAATAPNSTQPTTTNRPGRQWSIIAVGNWQATHNRYVGDAVSQFCRDIGC